MGVILPFRRRTGPPTVEPPRSGSTLLMVAHPRGVPYVTNDPDVAASLQLDEEVRHHGRYDISNELQTKVMQSVREKLVADFGGSTCAAWERITIELMDGSEFLFWPHQFEAVFEAVQEAVDRAAEQGYGIVPDVFCPVALNLEDLAAIHRWMEMHAEEYKALGEQQVESFRQGFRNLIRGGYTACMPADQIADNLPEDTVIMYVPEGPTEVQ